MSTKTAADAKRPARQGRRNTRDVVLDRALDLFNARGAARVTTAQIAAAAKVNEGNLYYYFRTKQALVVALFEQHEARMDNILSRPDIDLGNPRACLDLLRHWFSSAWDFRFLFRDLPELLTMAPELRERLPASTQRIRAPVEALISGMQAAGLARLSDEECAVLIDNLWIVSTYWALYLEVQRGVSTLGPDHIEWAVGQVIGLMRPYLSPAALAWLEAA